MGEQDYHDAFYLKDAGRIFEGPLFACIRRRQVALLLGACGLNSASRVLSLGTGTGGLECLAAPALGHITGIDLSPVAVTKATSTAAAKGIPNTTFQTGNLSETQLPDAPFDAVWALALLHHLPVDRQQHLLEQCLRVLRPGGVLVAIDPNALRLVKLARFLFPGAYTSHHSPDERELHPRELRGRFENAGFCDIHVGFHSFFLGPLAWVCPRTPACAVPPMSALDTFLAKFPGIRRFASDFVVSGRKA